MDVYQNFLQMAENDPEYYDIDGQFRQSLGIWLKYADKEGLLVSSGNDFTDEYRAGQLFTEFEAFHGEMGSGDDSPHGRMAQALIGINARRPEDWWNVGETPEEFRS